MDEDGCAADHGWYCCWLNIESKTRCTAKVLPRDGGRESAGPEVALGIAYLTGRRLDNETLREWHPGGNKTDDHHAVSFRLLS